MAVKYVKDFAFDSGFGYTGSAGKTPVRGYNRGGKVFDNSTRNPISKFPELAPAMVGKGPGKMGGKTSDVAPMSTAKANPQIAKYAKGGKVKKPPMAKPMKAKMMKKAEGGPVAEITPSDGMSPLQAMAKPKYEELLEALPMVPGEPSAEFDLRVPPLPPVKREFVMPPEFDETGMRKGPDRGGSRMYDPTAPFAPELMQADLQQTPPPLDYERMDDAHTRMTEMNQELMRQMEAMRNKSAPLTAKIESPLVPASKRYPAPELMDRPLGDLRPLPEEPNYRVPLFGDEPPIGTPLPPSPLARAAMPTKADRMATRRDNMMAARDIMDRYVAGNRNAMPRRSMAPGMRGMAESKARRAMPVAPREPMIQLPRAPQGGIMTYAKGGKVSKGEQKIGKVMGEFKRGELHSGSKKGPVVTNPKQAKAIALSEARAAGAKIPKKAMGGKACG